MLTVLVITSLSVVMVVVLVVNTVIKMVQMLLQILVVAEVDPPELLIMEETEDLVL